MKIRICRDEEMRLGDIFKLSSGKSLPEKKRTAGEYNVYGGNGVTGKHNEYFVEEPTIVIGRVGEYCGAVHLTTDKCWVTDNALMVTNWFKEVDKEFLVYVLTAMNLHQYAKTVGQPSISQGNIYDLEIDLPEIGQQREIVNILNRVNGIINSRRKELQKLDELIKARFVEMFGDPISNDKNWNVGTINEIGTCVAGATPSTKENKYWQNGTIPWMSSGEVNKGRIFETNEKITKLGYENASTKLVPPKTVVLAMAGQGRTRGTVAITEIELCTNQSICSIVNNEKINSEFLLNYLKMHYKKLRNTSTNSEGRGGLNLKIIGNYPVFIPPIELQNRFADFAREVDKSRYVSGFYKYIKHNKA